MTRNYLLPFFAGLYLILFPFLTTTTTAILTPAVLVAVAAAIYVLIKRLLINKYVSLQTEIDERLKSLQEV